jgi:hypothetical protein
VGRLLLLLTLALAGAAGLLGAAGWRWQRAPAPVPDHAAPFVATQPLLFAAGNSISQRVRAGRDGLRAVDLIVVAENADLPGEVEVRLSEWPSGRELRVARRPARDVPAGEPWRFRPGQPDEQWLTFGFDPLPDSAGREYRLTVSYPEGKDDPGQRLAVLAHFPGRYPHGNLAQNGDPRSGNLLFRLAASGTRGLALAQGRDNLARAQPYFPGSLALPAILVGAGLALVLLLGAAVLRAQPGAPGPPGAPGQRGEKQP